MATKTIIECTLIICGETMVGKSSLIDRLIDNSFNDTPFSTFVASSKKMEIILDDVVIQFSIWDTAGQEKFRSMNKIFYKRADVVLLIYDITSERTFKQIKDYWLQEIRNHSINKQSKHVFYHNSYWNCG